MRTYGEVQILLFVFLNFAREGAKWSASDPGHFTFLIGLWLGPRYSLDAAKREKSMALRVIEP